MTLSKFYKTILFVPYNITVAVVGAQLLDVAGKPSERTATHDPAKLKLELVCPKIDFGTLFRCDSISSNDLSKLLVPIVLKLINFEDFLVLKVED